MISPVTTARPQHRYDHRFRELVQRTGDLTIATDRGVPRSTARGWLRTVPRSTARGWLRTVPTVVVTLAVADLTEFGTAARGPETPTTRPETRRAAPARAGSAARLRLHVVGRATARWFR